MKPSPRIILILLLLFSPCLGLSQMITGRLVTSIYGWEKFDRVDASRTILRGAQSVLLDAGGSDWSVHSHFQASGASEHGGDDFRALYLYGKLKNVAELFDLSLGRQPFYAGVGMGTIDGASLTLRFSDNRYRFISYGGYNTPDEFGLKGWRALKKNFTLGGQFVTTAISDMRIGLSYFQRQRERQPYWATRLDSLFNPLSVFVEPNALKEEYAGLDASYNLLKLFAYGRYDHDLANKKVQRAEFSLRYKVLDDLTLSGEFLHRTPRVAANSFFSVFPLWKVNEYELGADQIVSTWGRFFVRGAYVDYSDEKSFRYTFGISSEFVGFTYRGATGYAGELSTLAVQATYPLMERKLIPTAALTQSSYRQSATSERRDALAMSLGAIVRPVSTISVDSQIQWLANTFAERDVRYFCKVNFWFAERL